MLVATELIQSLCRHEVWSGLAWADTKARYRRTTIGPFWITLSTGAMVGSVGIVYANLFGQELAHYLPFLTVGIILWTFISTSVSEGCNVFIAAAGYIKSVPMLLATHVFRLLARNAIILAHNLVLIVALWLLFRWPVGPTVLLVLPGLLIDMVAICGVVLVLGILSARFRDIPQIVVALMQLLFLLTPIVWMTSALKSPDLALIVAWNPMYYLLEIVRGPLLGQSPPLTVWLIAVTLSLTSLAVGAALYQKFARRVAYWL